MKFFLSIIIIALFSWLSGLISFLPWYSFVAVAFVVSVLFKQKPVASFLSGFFALFFLWAILALIKDIPNEHLLSTKVASILPFKGNYTILVIATGFIGGLLGGLSALTGSFLKK
jgi:hypothetical protein